MAKLLATTPRSPKSSAPYPAEMQTNTLSCIFYMYILMFRYYPANNRGSFYFANNNIGIILYIIRKKDNLYLCRVIKIINCNIVK